ncbi:MAG TPA: type II secretion system protein [Candidatus Paceibacterota bacterium]|jgi:prepilin-type N-terminal cleavage/methylation domain-containing protein|nr:type II secretion system protein [Candidatus Paceibacterota bacterium]
MSNHSRHKKNSGFSLLEVLVVVAIAGAIVLIVGNFGNNISGLNTLVSSELQAKSGVTQEVQIMVEAIQSAKTSANGGYPIDAASTSSFAFYTDINKNGTADHVRYFYASSTIYQGIIAPTGTPATYSTSSEVLTSFIGNVIIPSSTPLFSYYDTSYTGTQSPLTSPIAASAVRLVRVSFEVQANQTSTLSRSPLQYFSSLVDIRNLDSN